MKKAKLYVFGGLALLVVVLGTLFYLQNEATQVYLFLDLGVAAWKTDTPLPLPLLLLMSFAAGLGVMGLYTVILLMRRSRRSPDTTRKAMQDFASDDQVFDDF